MARFNGQELTAASMQATRDWVAENAQACIDEVKTGAVRVNDEAAYTAWMRERAATALTGGFDHTFSFLQRAYFIQTGESVALLA